MNETLKRHLISMGHTFIATFLITVGPLVAAADFSEGVTQSAIWSIVLAGGRAAVKALIAAGIELYNNRNR